ncbi:MAG: flavodoxin [Bacilli bacterium]|nr:flavodoxin [Bacilli bacterium]
MNKKITFILEILLFIVIGVGLFFVINGSPFGNNEISDNGTEANQPVDVSKQSVQTTNGKILVVYFSRTGENYSVGNVDVGNTAMMASYIIDYLDADSYEIIPVNSYPNNYDETTTQAQEEKKNGVRPQIKYSLNDIDFYDTVFIGYPIWWGDLPMIVYTFIEEYDLSGKTIIPFNTHEGSGSAGTYNTLKNKLVNSNVIIDGLALRGSKARTSEGKEETINWLKGLGY